MYITPFRKSLTGLIMMALHQRLPETLAILASAFPGGRKHCGYWGYGLNTFWVDYHLLFYAHFYSITSTAFFSLLSMSSIDTTFLIASPSPYAGILVIPCLLFFGESMKSYHQRLLYIGDQSHYPSSLGFPKSWIWKKSGGIVSSILLPTLLH